VPQTGGEIDLTGVKGMRGARPQAGGTSPDAAQNTPSGTETTVGEVTVVRLDAAKVPAPLSSNPSRGPADAPVTVQLFSDFECPFCARALPSIAELERKFQGLVRIVWRNYPLPFHNHARLAARAALEAQAQRGDAAFWRMHDRIYERAESGLDEQVLDALARDLGLDISRFQAAVKDERHDAAIDRDVSAGDAVGIEGTPAFLVNDYYLMGLQPPGTLEAVVELALSDQKAGRSQK